MSATLIPFPSSPQAMGGLVYTAWSDEVPDYWALYYQPEAADEPDLIGTSGDPTEAARIGREVARRHHARFVVDLSHEVTR